MARSSPDAPTRQAAGKCPICGAPTEQQYRPFCSRRCADVDLSRWLRGAYAIPVETDDDEDGESTDSPAAGENNPDDAPARKRRDP
jgi:endogenous inhibitor of DNA gyrase (YacG/DUF329 family)